MTHDEHLTMCSNCGTLGHKCYGDSEEGPACDDWIGATAAGPCCHACHDDAYILSALEGGEG